MSTGREGNASDFPPLFWSHKRSEELLSWRLLDLWRFTKEFLSLLN